MGIKTQAEILRHQILCGLATREEIIGWADGHLGDLDLPHISLIEVSMVNLDNADELAALLKNISGTADVKAVATRLFDSAVPHTPPAQRRS